MLPRSAVLGKLREHLLFELRQRAARDDGHLDHAQEAREQLRHLGIDGRLAQRERPVEIERGEGLNGAHPLALCEVRRADWRRDGGSSPGHDPFDGLEDESVRSVYARRLPTFRIRATILPPDRAQRERTERPMKLPVRLIVLCGALGLQPLAGVAATSPPILGAPAIFGVGSPAASANDGSPTFSPDGKTLFFARSGSTWSTIMESNNVDGHWSAPRIAPFSGTWSDWAPEFSPDGRWVIFVEVRPDTHANLWRVERPADGWSSPRGCPMRSISAARCGSRVSRPTAASTSSHRRERPQAALRFAFRNAQARISRAQPLPFSDGSKGDVDPEVAPDESFLVFASNGRVSRGRKDHLFIAFRRRAAVGVPCGYGIPVTTSTAPVPITNRTWDPIAGRCTLAAIVFCASTSRERRPKRSAIWPGCESTGNGSHNAWSVSLSALLDRN